MSLYLIRRDCRDHNTVRCSCCGRINTVADKRLDSDRCRFCEMQHKGWQAELVAPFSPARALKARGA